MSQQSRSGMMSVTRPRSMEELENELLLSNDPASPNVAAISPAPVAAPISPSPSLTPISPAPVAPSASPSPITVPISAEATKTRVAKTVTGSPSVSAVMQSEQQRLRVKVTVNTRVDDFIVEAIDNLLKTMNGPGKRKITKEMLIVQCLIQGLALTPPEGWTVYND